jgi:hypothetical protein
MQSGASLADRAQAALDAWVSAMSSWNDALPSSSLTSAGGDPWWRHSEDVDLLYRRWRELAREVAAHVEQRRARSPEGASSE